MQVYPSTKVCSRCNEEKPTDKFYRRGGSRPTDLNSRCIACTAEIHYERQSSDDGYVLRRRSTSLARYRATTHGVFLEEYRAMASYQGGKCAICGIKPGESMNGRWGKRVALVVDHNHDTGVVRQLLCNGCNSGLGFFKENPDALIAAAEYLKRHKEVL